MRQQDFVRNITVQGPDHQPMAQDCQDHSKILAIADYPHQLPLSSVDQDILTSAFDRQPRPTPTEVA